MGLHLWGYIAQLVCHFKGLYPTQWLFGHSTAVDMVLPPDYVVSRLNSSLQQLYGRHHKPVDCETNIHFWNGHAYLPFHVDFFISPIINKTFTGLDQMDIIMGAFKKKELLPFGNTWIQSLFWWGLITFLVLFDVYFVRLLFLFLCVLWPLLSVSLDWPFFNYRILFPPTLNYTTSNGNDIRNDMVLAHNV